MSNTSKSSKVLSLSLSQGVLSLVSVVSGMVFARVLSKEDYGTYLQTFLAYDFVVPVLTLGLPSAMFYFLPSSKNGRRLILENLILLFLAGSIFSLFLLFGGTELLAKRFNNPDLNKTLRWIVFYPLYTFPVIISAVLVIRNKVTLNAFYNFITGLILTVSLIIGVLLFRNYEIPILIKIILPLFFFPFATFFSFKHENSPWEKPKLSSMWNILKFSIPLGLGTVFGTLTIQLSNIIVSWMTSPAEFAIYANGARDIPFVSIITGSISVIIMADMSQKIKEGNLKGALESFRQSALMGALFLIPLMFFFFIYAKDFIILIYSDRYIESILPFRIYLLYLPVKMVYYGSALIAFGRTREIFVRSLIGFLLTGIFSFILTKYLGYIGAAIGTILVSYIWAIPYNFYTISKDFKCSALYLMPLKKISHVFIFSAVSTVFSLIVFLLPIEDIIIRIFIGAIVFGVVYIYIAMRYSEDFKAVATPYLNKIKNIIRR